MKTVKTVKDLQDYLAKFPSNTKLMSEAFSIVKFGETQVRSGKNFVSIVAHLPKGPPNGW